MSTSNIDFVGKNRLFNSSFQGFFFDMKFPSSTAGASGECNAMGRRGEKKSVSLFFRERRFYIEKLNLRRSVIAV